MLEDQAKLRRSGGPPVGLIVAGVTVILGLAGAYFLYEQWRNQAPLLPILTEEARQYLPHLALSDVEMKAEESFLEHTIVTIEGKITNKGGKTVRVIDLHCVFRDPYKQELGRELVHIVGRRGPPLKPGETQPFRLAFDNAPIGWNQTLPDLFIAQIVFEQ